LHITKLSGAAIHYQIEGPAGAPALLLLHSLGASASMWEAQLDAWRRRFRVIRYQVRGHGGAAPADVPELTMELLAGDALAVLDAAQVPVAHWCGISMGGMTAMWVAARFPDRVGRLVLCNTSAHMPPASLWQSRIDTARRDGMAALADAIIERWFTPRFRASSPEPVERIRAMLLSVDPGSYAAACAAIRDMDQRPTLAHIRAATLVVCGDEDPATPLSHSQLLCAGIPGARLAMLHAAHLSNVEAPEAFAAVVGDFLSKPDQR
jgi:3-oxoadipate enol-lactonase